MNTLFSKSGLICLALLLALATSASAQTPAATDPLKLDAAALSKAGISVATATRLVVKDELEAPGEVKANAYSTVLVAPRVEAQVIARKARLGEVVKAGQPLVVLSSIQVAETQGALIVAEQDWQRIASLGPQAVSARRYNQAKVQRDLARSKLRAYGLSNGQIHTLLRKGSAAADGSFKLLAPASGRITTDHFVIGERVMPGHTLFTLVKEDTVWVEAQLSPADAERVKPGTDTRILAHDLSLPGKVIQRSHQSNERTRTVPVRIAVDNRKDLLHPGEMVEVRLAVNGASSQLVVAKAAIVLLQNQPTVFLEKAKGWFEPIPVRPGATRGGWTVIKQGLKVGDRYVNQGAFALKARLLRSKLGED